MAKILRAVLVFLEKTRQKCLVPDSISFLPIKRFDFLDHHPIANCFIDTVI